MSDPAGIEDALENTYELHGYIEEVQREMPRRIWGTGTVVYEDTNITVAMDEWNDLQTELARLKAENALLKRNVTKALTYLMMVKQALLDNGEMDIAQEQGG